MTRRLGINEAEEVTLGTRGRSQQIPVLETLADGSHIPGKTTVAAMRAFLSGEGTEPQLPEIHRFEISNSLTGTVQTSRSQRVGATGSGKTLKFLKPTGSVISGTANFFGLSQGIITLPTPGIYQYTLEAYATRTGEGAVVDPFDSFVEFDGEGIEFDIDVKLKYPLFIGSIYTTQGAIIKRHYGAPQPVRYLDGAVIVPFAKASDYIVANGIETLSLTADIYNAGNSNAPSSPVNWRFTTQGQNIPCTLIIERF